MAPPALVIFDCDGVLVDSEPLAARVNAELLGELGWPITVEEVEARFIGTSYGHFRAEVEAHLGHRIPEGWDARFKERFEALAEDELVAMHGVDGVLDALVTAGVPICVASNSRRERVIWSLARTGLLHYFDGRIYSARDVPEPKPAPDVFLHAAAEMGTAAGSAVVVEDSRFGVEAARRAGMAVFAYAGGLTPRAALDGPGTTIYEHMADLVTLFGLPSDAAEAQSWGPGSLG